MAKPDLFICHTPYQVMIDFLRAKRSQDQPVLILSAVIPEAAALQERLAASGAFAEIRLFDETALPEIAYPDFLHRLLRQHGVEKRVVERTGFSILPKRYQNIYIHNDWSLLGRYLQDIGARYILCEDTLASTLWPRHPILEKQRTLPHFALRQKLGYDYLYWGDYRGVSAVETEDAARCKLFPEKLLENSKSALLHSLTDEEKAALRAVFITQELPEKADGAAILMTHSFVDDGAMTEETQNKIWQAVVQKHIPADVPFFIKAHPRDRFDYAKLFPRALVLERTMPSEVLNFALPFRFARAVTVQSTCLSGFEAADEKISLSLEDALALTESQD